VFGAEFANLSKVTTGWYDNSKKELKCNSKVRSNNAPSFSLNWFDQERYYVFSIKFESAFKIFNFSKADDTELVIVFVSWTDAFEVRAETAAALRISAHTGREYELWRRAE
jgi:hypothetical protein